MVGGFHNIRIVHHCMHVMGSLKLRRIWEHLGNSGVWTSEVRSTERRSKWTVYSSDNIEGDGKDVSPYEQKLDGNLILTVEMFCKLSCMLVILSHSYGYY
ncbi:unnamed protein product [Cuscuta epithymum]|uniref:Uncharacterized protein n=1 Tax=Cuscuta epithymum TaxID=186058 RepID=A0AAV0DS15_9ASTE|nr:unnamed protein product [Cuscuta epithymum]